MGKRRRGIKDLTEADRRKAFEVVRCTNNGEYRKCNPESGENYCIYFTISNQRRKIDCTRRSDSREMVLMGSSEDPLFRHYVGFYKCKDRKFNEKCGAIIE